MNPSFNYWVLVERMQSMQAEAGAARARHAAARARRLRRSGQGPVLALAGLGRRYPGITVRGTMKKAVEEL